MNEAKSRSDRRDGPERSALLIGQSPLQVLNLLEAAEADGVEGRLLIPWSDPLSREATERLLALLGPLPATFLPLRGAAGLATPLRLALVALRLRGRVSRVYFGTYTSWVSFLVNLLGAKEHVLVDDGQKTINILTAPHLVGLGRERAWPFSRDFVRTAELFTFYDELAAEHGRRARPNRLVRLSERLRGAGAGAAEPLDGDGVVFIGTHIEDTYGPFEEHLARVLTAADGRPVTYVLHRRDDEGRMRELGRRLGFHAVRFELPLELVFNQLWRPHRPEVWTFGTTAIDTLLAMHEDLRVRVFRLEPGAFTRPRTGEAFASIYRHHEGVARVDLVEIPQG
jgi:hypothetical protein